MQGSVLTVLTMSMVLIIWLLWSERKQEESASSLEKRRHEELENEQVGLPAGSRHVALQERL